MEEQFEEAFGRIVDILRDPGSIQCHNPNITPTKAADLILQIRACLFRVVDEVMDAASEQDLLQILQEISDDIESVGNIDVH